MKRILVLNYEFPPLGGGAGNATYYLLKEFAKDKDIEIDLVTSSVDGFRKEAFSDNITIHFLDIGKKGNLHHQSNMDLLKYSKRAYSYSKKLIQEREGGSFGIVHAFFGIPCGYIAMKLESKFNIPYIVSLRGSDVPFYSERFYWLDKLVFKRLSKKIWHRARVVVANSEGLKDLALKAVPDQQIEVIPNGVDIDEFYPKEIDGGGGNKPITIVSTGRLIERKGYIFLIEAISGLDNVKVVLIGDGPLKSELEGQAKDLGVNVGFLGSKPHGGLVGYLQDADIFCLPSLNEGMSNSILEAMACGLPIIATDTGGSKELINDNGFIVEKEDQGSIREAIDSYLNDPELLVTHGKTSRKLAEGMSWGEMAGEYRSIYSL